MSTFRTQRTQLAHLDQNVECIVQGTSLVGVFHDKSLNQNTQLTGIRQRQIFHQRWITILGVPYHHSHHRPPKCPCIILRVINHGIWSWFGLFHFWCQIVWSSTFCKPCHRERHDELWILLCWTWTDLDLIEVIAFTKIAHHWNHRADLAHCQWQWSRGSGRACHHVCA